MNKPKIWVDTRQQKGKHTLKHQQMQDRGYELFEGYSSPFGDYCFVGGTIAVDTKKDVLELLSCLGKGHQRFSAECNRAQMNGIKLVILTEELPENGDIRNWKSPVWKSTTDKHKKGDPVTKMSVRNAYRTMWGMTQRYGVVFQFCDKSETGNKVVDFLEGIEQ